jgi:16S rRNA (cytosine1402-N4)-methyltransferase
MTRTHVPVLAGELIAALDPAPGAVAVDCTFGAGGHARLVADRIGPGGEIVCIDRDPHAEEHFAGFAAEASCATRFIHGDYADVLPELIEEGLAADLVYLDLGISSMQVDARERGFSYSYEAPLDMRMDPASELDARTVVNEWPEARLAQVFRRYGEERFARPVAREIARRRRKAPIETTSELVDAIKRAVPVPAQFAGGHPARRVFQAIRIAVNDELESLERALPAAWALLRPGGRMAAISFHSLEDRMVKRFFADRARGCICPPDLPVCACGREPEAELVNRRAVRPSAGEVAGNPRAQSGRLRAAVKVAQPGGEGSAGPAPKISDEGR